MFYPIIDQFLSLSLVTAIIMIFVIPSFKSVFTSFGADLPAPTLVVIAMSDFFVAYSYVIADMHALAASTFYCTLAAVAEGHARRRSRVAEASVLGEMRRRHQSRAGATLATTFAAGVPLVEALDSMGQPRQLGLQRSDQAGADGSTSAQAWRSPCRTRCLSEHGDSDDLDRRGESALARLDAVHRADYYEREVDETVDALASLLEPMITGDSWRRVEAS